MALSTARMHKVRGRPPLLAAGISSLSHSHSSSVRSLGYVFSFIFSFYTTHEDFSDRLLEAQEKAATSLLQIKMDHGRERSGRRTKCLHRMVQFADDIHKPMQLLYYPPYHSKYNPIERCWGILELKG